ncbi:MAG: beta-N-acetylhexosaminidase, partial [Ilumatobacteraceae bacterium]|nr:beta-N-acetylhexosaminidase [Ilumatobacteraceae bacterium]
IVASCVDDRPASISARWTAYLRNELNFDGVVITDALDMRAVAGNRGADGVADAAVEALAAGADLLCLGSNFDAAEIDLVVSTVAAAISSGRLDRGDLEQSVRRIAKLRRHGRPSTASAVDPSAAAEVARRAITIAGSVPVGLHAIVECRPQPNMASFNVTWGLARHLADEGWRTQAIDHAGDTAWTPVDDDGVVIVVRDLDVHPWQRDVVDQQSAMRRPVVVVELGWPSAVPPKADCYIVSQGAALASTRAVAELLAGRPVPSSRGEN